MRYLYLSAAILFLSSVVPGLGAAQELSETDQAALSAAEEWIQLIDDAEYDESWEQTDPRFRSAMTVEQWSTTLAGVAEQTGDLVSRAFREVVAAPASPNVPAGEMVMVHFRSSFQNVPQVTERIVLRDAGEDGWKVAGYFLMPPE